MTRNPQHRGLRPIPANLGVTPCAPGESSAVVRVRGESEAVAEFVKLEPTTRGDVVSRWYHAQREGSHAVD